MLIRTSFGPGLGTGIVLKVGAEPLLAGTWLKTRSRCVDLTTAFILHYLGLLLLWDVEMRHVVGFGWLCTLSHSKIVGVGCDGYTT
jgi:hypothetical protein